MKEDGGIYMSKEGQLVYRVVSEFLEGKLYRKEAAELLEVRERTIQAGFCGALEPFSHPRGI